jgi:hypothetical protein
MGAAFFLALRFAFRSVRRFFHNSQLIGSLDQGTDEMDTS